MALSTPARPGHGAEPALRQATEPAERKAGRLLAFALAASLLASGCCVLPLALVLVGVTGAWMVHLQALRPITPYAIGLTVAALAWAGRLLFRRARLEACTVEDGACATTRPLMRRLFIGCAVFIALLLGFPLIAPLFY
jgi:mercuric ion transport protein